MRKVRWVVCAVVIALCATLAPSSADAADGDLDTGFGVDGVVATDLTGGASEEARAVAIAPDGKVVATGMAVTGAATDIAVVRYTADGHLDTTFGGDGIVLTPLFESFDIGFATTVDPDGRIIVSAQAIRDDHTVSVLLRYLDDGSLDPAFGDNGRVIFDVGGSHSTLRSVAVDDGGDILAAGFSQAGGIHSILVRVHSDGSPDETFGEGGIATVPALSWALDFALQMDGRIVATGWGNSGGVVVARLLADGTLDPSYGDGGEVTFPLPADRVFEYGATTIAVQADQKTVIGGTGMSDNADGSRSPDFMVARLTFDGAPDPTFSGDGIHTVSVTANADDTITSVDVSDDGAILASGTTGPDESGDIDFAVARFTTMGVLDTSFSGDGLARIRVSELADRAFGSALSDDGLVIAGSNNGGYNDPDADLVIARVETGTSTPSDAAPTLTNPGPRTVAEGNTLSFRLRANDPDGDLVSFWSDPMPPGARLDSTGRFTWTPDYSQAGPHELTLHASDNHAGHTQTVRVVATVTDTIVMTQIKQDVRVSQDITVTGRVEPAPASGGTVTVDLYRQLSGVFELVDSSSLALARSGRFSVTFPRPDGGKTCRIDTTFPGQEPYQSSTHSTTVKC